MAHKVIIRTHIFDYAEKAPFVPSGVSVHGAVEYDDERDLVRCHECGEWFQSVSSHVREHGIDSIQYRQRHGLLLKTGLVSRGTRDRLAALMKANGVRPSPSYRPKPVSERRAPRIAHAHRFEQRNQDGRCRAQTLFRIQTLAERLGRTPTVAELEGKGFNRAGLVKLFDGLSINGIMLAAGLTPNQRGKSREPFSDGDLLERLADFYAKHRRIPTPREASESGLPSRSAYRRAFGNMTGACRLLGIPVRGFALNERLQWEASDAVATEIKGQADSGVVDDLRERIDSIKADMSLPDWRKDAA